MRDTMFVSLANPPVGLWRQVRFNLLRVCNHIFITILFYTAPILSAIHYICIDHAILGRIIHTVNIDSYSTDTGEKQC